MTYFTEDDAIKRVDMLKQLGIWPGIIRLTDDAWRLTYDPPGSSYLDAHGYGY